MQDEKISSEHGASAGGSTGDKHKRVDTEHRGVTGTLVLTDVLDDNVRSNSLSLIPVIYCVKAANAELCDGHKRLLI